MTFMLNEKEKRAFDIYCSRFNIKNKAAFIREMLMKAVIKRFNEDYPSLWEEPFLISKKEIKKEGK